MPVMVFGVLEMLRVVAVFGSESESESLNPIARVASETRIGRRFGVPVIVASRVGRRERGEGRKEPIIMPASKPGREIMEEEDIGNVARDGDSDVCVQMCFSEEQ